MSTVSDDSPEPTPDVLWDRLFSEVFSFGQDLFEPTWPEVLANDRLNEIYEHYLLDIVNYASPDNYIAIVRLVGRASKSHANVSQWVLVYLKTLMMANGVEGGNLWRKVDEYHLKCCIREAVICAREKDPTSRRGGVMKWMGECEQAGCYEYLWEIPSNTVQTIRETIEEDYGDRPSWAG